MANSTTKPASNLSNENVLRSAHNDQDATIAVSGFINSKIGHKVVRTVVSPTVDNYAFFDGTTLLYTIQVTYNNAGHDEIDQVERIN